MRWTGLCLKSLGFGQTLHYPPELADNMPGQGRSFRASRGGNHRAMSYGLTYAQAPAILGCHFSNLAKLIVLAVSLVVATLLVMIPFLGWLVTLLLVTFGMGVIAALVMTRWSTNDRERLAAAPAA